MMKKLLTPACLIWTLAALAPEASAQSVFTADLGLLPAAAGTQYTINAGDSLDVGFRIYNQGPDDIDTSNFIIYGIPGLPPGLALVVQDENGHLIPVANGDTIQSRGLRFSNLEPSARDTTMEFCFFLMVNEDQDEFIHDPNQLNDTICYQITWKGTGTGIAGRTQALPLQMNPNPAVDKAAIELAGDAGSEGTVQIYSIDGRLWRALPVKRSDTRVEWDVHDWPKGVYMVDFRNERQRRTGRLIVR